MDLCKKLKTLKKRVRKAIIESLKSVVKGSEVK